MFLDKTFKTKSIPDTLSTYFRRIVYCQLVVFENFVILSFNSSRREREVGVETIGKETILTLSIPLG